MAQLQKIDSNITGLRYAEEESLGVLPGSPVWIPLEPNSYADFGGEITTIARNPINPSRQRKKGVTTDLQASGGFNTDLTQENLQDILQGFFFADLRTKTEFDVATVGQHYEAASAVVVAGGTSGYLVGDLLTLVGGTSTTAGVAYVATVDGGGVVLTVNFSGTGAVPGDYTVVPGNPVSTTGGTGTGAVTLTVTFDESYSGYTVAADGDDYVAGDLLFAKGFDDATNNGLKHVVAGSTSTLVKVSEDTVNASTQTGTISRVGYVFAEDELDVDATGDLPKLVSAGKDLTEFGLIPGEWVFVGGDGTGEFFDTAANNGFARVRSVAEDGTYIELDKTQNTMVTETGTDLTINLFFGRVLKNELGSSVIRRTYQLERTLGAPDDDDLSALQAEYLVGAVPNEFALNVKVADKITCDLSFVATDNEQVDADTGPKAGDRPAIAEADAFNTSSDITRIKMNVVDLLSGNPTPLFGFVEDLKLTIANNVSPNKAVGRLGAFEVTAGTFAVGGTLSVYFSDVGATQAVRDNADVTLDFHAVKKNGGVTFDIPLLSLGDARVNVEQDKAITLPLSVDAATAAKLHADTDYTLLMVFWDYLPDLAD